ncbi:MAG TPA: Gfo/Idh/MocA family oxidoreductase [Polyangiaceae bacterium]|nr:Gfo/Idh/MocA family oxidoreductase [Polyangiaceae bacterium]
MPALRLGLLGTGVAAEKLYLPAFEELRGKVDVVACANRTRKKAERYARIARIPKVVDGADELFALPEVDAVMVSLPIDAQPEYVLRALAAGKPVLSEKPVGPSVAAAKRLIKAARRYPLPWLVGENFTFMAHARKLRELVKAEKLGEVRLVEARQLTRMDAKNPYFHTAWRTDPRHVGGFVTDAGVHIASLLRASFGTPRVVKNLTASFDARLPPLDTALALLKFESGLVGTWSSSFTVPDDGPMLRVFGTRGRAELFYDRLVVEDARARERVYPAGASSFRAELEHFAAVVQKGRPLALTPEEALADLALLEAVVAG